MGEYASVCNSCDGAGETCGTCNEVPDNCECSPENFLDCQECGGSGEVLVDEDEDEQEA